MHQRWQLYSAGLLVAGSLLGSRLSADDWTQWRGNQRDGKSAETGLLDSWPPQGPKLLWQTNDLGNGYSTPSSAGGMLFLLANKDLENEEVIALSLADGSQVWATRIGRVGPNEGPNYPAARSTPTIDGDVLYALGSDGDLVCLETKTGAQRWSKNLRSEFGGKPGNWAYSESPLVDGEKIVCSPGGADATVVALNKSDGSVIWKAPLQAADDASYSSPVITEVDGVRQYVLFLSKGVIGLNAETGDLLWRYSKTAGGPANILTPVIEGNLVYTGASRAGGALVKASGSKSDPAEVYYAQGLPSGIGGAVLVDGNLYGSTGDAFKCIDYATGETKWQDRAIGACSVCYADGKLFLHGENDNTVAMIAATDEAYKELGKFTPPNGPQRPSNGKAWTYPIIVDGKLIIRDVGTVWCFDISK